MLFPAPGEPVSPITRARPLCGNKAFKRLDHPGERFSTAEMARASERTSPERNDVIEDWIS